MIIVALLFLCASTNAVDLVVKNDLDTDDSNDTRKYYGLSFNNRCKSYQRVFKCMSACKAMSFQVFRIDQRCKCTCHEMKTTTILPFFKWRTNGTTRALPKTRSVKLYEIVGTISPPPETEPEPTNATTNFTCPTFNFTDANSTSPLESTTALNANSSGGDAGDSSTDGSSDTLDGNSDGTSDAASSDAGGGDTDGGAASQDETDATTETQDAGGDRK